MAQEREGEGFKRLFFVQIPKHPRSNVTAGPAFMDRIKERLAVAFFLLGIEKRLD